MSSPLLLDTCAVIWAAEGQLTDEIVAILNERNDAGEWTYVSPITAWEFGLLFARGRLRSPLGPQEYFRQLSALPTVRVAALSPDILIASSFLPGPAPRDPADRIIVATARELGLTVLTRDKTLLDYGKGGYLRVLEC